MTNEILSAITLLEGTSISLLDAARLVRNILDSKPQVSSFSDIEFCSYRFRETNHKTKKYAG